MFGDLFDNSFTSLIIQVLVAVGGGLGGVQIMLVRANRRKLVGEASSNEANAASTLSGAALKMVENAQAQQALAESRTATVQGQLDAEKADNEQLRSERSKLQWENMELTARNLQLSQLITQTSGVTLPRPPQIGGPQTPALPSSPQPVDIPVEKPDLD